MTESANDIDIIDIYPTAPVVFGATLTFSYPLGRSAGSYTQDNAALHVRATNTSFSDVAVTYGTSSMTLTYNGATIPAGSKVSLQVELTTGITVTGFYDVLDYGVVADGVTDSTTALQAIISAAEAAGGGEVLLPAGTIIHTGLTVRGPIKIRGAGRDLTSLKLKTGSNTDNITVTPVDQSDPLWIEFCDFMIDGNKSGQSAGSGVYFPTLGTGYGQAAYMRFMIVKQCKEHGVEVQSNRNAGGFYNCGFRENDLDGLYVSTSGDFRSEGCSFAGNGRYGVNLIAPFAMFFDKCYSYSNTNVGVNIQSTSQECFWIGGSIDRNYNHGVSIVGGNDTAAIRGFKFMGTVFYENSNGATGTYSDIKVNNAVGGVAFIGCHFLRSAGDNPKYVIETAGTATNIAWIANSYESVTAGNEPWLTDLTNDEADLLVVADPYLDGRSTKNQVYRNSNPLIELYETDASSNQKRWRLDAETSELRGRLLSDDGVSSSRWLTVQRSAHSVTNVFLGGSGTADAGLVVISTASGVNKLAATGSTTGNAVSLGASGSDSNIDIAITPKGTGNVKMGTWTSNADAAVNGYVTIKDAAGNSRKLATIA